MNNSINEPLTEPGMGVQASAVPWPAGPHYFDLTGSEGSVAWVRYRLWAADWHTRTLRTVAGPDGNYDRLVGVEMALDGALNNLSGAFDAGTAIVIRAAEVALGVAEDDLLPVYRYTWKTARSFLEKRELGTNEDGSANNEVWRVIIDVDNALAGERDPVPTGWLAQLRRLRNRVAHQDTLARHHDRLKQTAISQLGGWDGDAFDHLARACDQVHDLTEQMVALATHLGSYETPAGRERPRWFPASV